MKRFFATALFLAAGILAMAQNYPSEWVRYTSDGYFHDIESAADKQTALSLARSNLAKQIQVKVNEVSRMGTEVVGGKTKQQYFSSKLFSTDVDMSLSETKSHYNETLGKYYVIVYVNKAEACTYYEKEVKMLISNAGNAIDIAGNYIASGFKQKAKTELEKVLKLLDGAAKPFFWLNVCGFDEKQMLQYLTQVQDYEQTAKQWLADLEYGTTYCVLCEADLFGQRYVKLANEIKGELSSSGCNFVDDPESADYVIRIQCSARKYNEFQGAYFTYVDAAVSLDKKATSQTIFEDEVSVKGSHTLGYNEAARDGYKKISKEISNMLKSNIKL